MNKPSIAVISALVGILSTQAYAGPAPALTRVEVGWVSSSTKPNGEAIRDNQFLTSLDHGGRTVVVWVREYGYGTARQATLNGVRANSITTTPVLSGRTVVGWVAACRFDNVRSVNNSSFVYSASSQNWPWGIRTDRVTIR